MKKLVTIILISLSFLNCTQEEIHIEPVLIDGMFYSYDTDKNEVARAKNKVSYLFSNGELTVRDGQFLIFKGEYEILDRRLIATSNIVNMVYGEGDTIEFKMDINKHGNYFTVYENWLWFVSSHNVEGTYKFIYKNE